MGVAWFLGLLVLFAHHPAVCYGVLGLFLGVVTATKEYQDDRKLRRDFWSASSARGW